jgi:hypothetical protein
MRQVMLDSTDFMRWFRFKLDTPYTYININWKYVYNVPDRYLCVWCDFYNENGDILKLYKQDDICNEDTMRSVLDGISF